jgi:cell division protein ZapA
MTTDRSVRVSVRILEKEYQLACLPEERSELLDSAEYLNGKMREIRDGGNIVGLDRIAVVAALNLAHELLRIKSRGESTQSDVGQKIRTMRERVESALARGQQLDL